MYDSTKPYANKILNFIKDTWETPYVSIKNGIITKKFHHKEYHHSDGIGTKGIYHWKKRSFKEAVVDALAMNLNDLAMERAMPYAIIDHIFLPEDNHEAIIKIIKNLSEECRIRNIAITGGETAIHNDMSGLEISMTMLGFLKDKPKRNQMKRGDLLVGFKSNGLHSNGFTKIREIFVDKYRDDFTKPTQIYLEKILELNEKFKINGMMHITGGAFTKLRKILSAEDDIIIPRNHQLSPQEIFKEIYSRGVSDEEMYKTFNCGIGFVLSASPKDSKAIVSQTKDSGLETSIIGKITKGKNKIKIYSMFSDRKIEL